MRVLAFRSGNTPEATVTHSIRLRDNADFLRLFSMCGSIKVYYYSIR